MNISVGGETALASVRPLPRRSRHETQEQTRRLLVDAATEIFLRDGFVGASVGAVAAFAGFSTGAVYSNFPSKEALFLAVVDRHLEARSAALGEILVSSPDVDSLLEAVAAWFTEFMGEGPGWPLLTIEGTIRARQSPDLAAALSDRHVKAEGALAKALEAVLDRFGLPLPRSGPHLASAIYALGHGLILHRLVDPDAETQRVFVESLRDLLHLQPARKSDQK